MRVYVNATPVEVSVDATALDAVRHWNAAEADAVAAGDRTITDSRGLPVPASTPLRVGTIVRVVSARARSADDLDS
jgi:hypothetical protein